MEQQQPQNPQQPQLCANGCGFFGNPVTQNLCSKCYRTKVQATPPSIPSTSQTPSTPAADPPQNTTETKTETQPEQKDTTRCFKCSRKVGLLGFKCRCNYVFCSLHRYSEQHNCSFDYKAMHKAKLEVQNPQIVGSKIEKIN